MQIFFQKSCVFTKIGKSKKSYIFTQLHKLIIEKHFYVDAKWHVQFKDIFQNFAYFIILLKKILKDAYFSRNYSGLTL